MKLKWGTSHSSFLFPLSSSVINVDKKHEKWEGFGKWLGVLRSVRSHLEVFVRSYEIGMIGKSIGTLLAVVSVGLQGRRHATYALKSSFLTRTIPSGLLMIIGGKQFSSAQYMAYPKGGEGYKSDIKVGTEGWQYLLHRGPECIDYCMTCNTIAYD